MSDLVLVLPILLLSLLGGACGVGLLVLACGSDTSPREQPPSLGSSPGGGQPRHPPRGPINGPPLLDAQPAHVRLREPGRLGDRLARPPRRGKEPACPPRTAPVKP